MLPNATPEQSIEIRLIDETLKILGPDGRYWIKRRFSDHQGNHCLMGALRLARHRLHPIGTDNVEVLIVEAIRQRFGILDYEIVNFNDGAQRTFAHVQDVLQLAKTVTLSPSTRELVASVEEAREEIRRRCNRILCGSWGKPQRRSGERVG